MAAEAAAMEVKRMAAFLANLETYPKPEDPKPDQEEAARNEKDDKIKTKVNELVRLCNQLDERIQRLEAVRNVERHTARMILIQKIYELQTELQGIFSATPQPNEHLLAMYKRELETLY